MRSGCDGMCAWKDAEVGDEDDRLVCCCIRMIGNSQAKQLYVDTDNTM
jgi:hypothetical protein